MVHFTVARLVDKCFFFGVFAPRAKRTIARNKRFRRYLFRSRRLCVFQRFRLLFHEGGGSCYPRSTSFFFLHFQFVSLRFLFKKMDRGLHENASLCCRFGKKRFRPGTENHCSLCAIKCKKCTLELSHHLRPLHCVLVWGGVPVRITRHIAVWGYIHPFC